MRNGGGPISGDEIRDGVSLTNLDQPLFDGAGAAKRDLVDYLDAVRDRILPVLADRPLSVIRVLRGQAPFMQKNVPKYTPSWVRTVELWAETSKREVSYALCNDRRTLLWTDFTTSEGTTVPSEPRSGESGREGHLRQSMRNTFSGSRGARESPGS
jgi:bifunctional non-homologous end joining protein LigD